MSMKEIIVKELGDASEHDLDMLLRIIRMLKSNRTGDIEPALLTESTLAKDWLKPEEEQAWADL